MQKLLILSGIALVVAGLAWPLLSRLGLGRLPGDISIQGEHRGFYFPMMTCIAALSLLFWLAGRF